MLRRRCAANLRAEPVQSDAAGEDERVDDEVRRARCRPGSPRARRRSGSGRSRPTGRGRSQQGVRADEVAERTGDEHCGDEFHGRQSTAATAPSSSPREAIFGSSRGGIANGSRACRRQPSASAARPRARRRAPRRVRACRRARARRPTSPAAIGRVEPPSRTSTSSALPVARRGGRPRPSRRRASSRSSAPPGPRGTRRRATSGATSHAAGQRRVVEPHARGPRLVEQRLELARRGASASSSTSRSSSVSASRPASRMPAKRADGVRRVEPARARLDHHHGQVMGDDVVELAGDPRALAPHGLARRARPARPRAPGCARRVPRRAGGASGPGVPAAHGATVTSSAGTMSPPAIASAAASAAATRTPAPVQAARRSRSSARTRRARRGTQPWAGKAAEQDRTLRRHRARG